MKTVVTLTTAAVERDSRTFKQAASVSRLGYRSIVYEGRKSSLDPARLPFELRSLCNGAPGENQENAVSGNSSPTQAQAADLSIFEQVRRVTKTPEGEPLFRNLRVRGDRVLQTLGLKKQAIVGWYIFRDSLERQRRIVKTVPRADLYYMHDFHYFPAVHSLCRKYGVRFIYDAHDFYSGIEDDTNQDPRAGYWRWLERKCVEKAAGVVTVCDGISALHEKEFGRASVVLRNCQDKRLDQTPNQTLRGRLGLGEDVFLLATVGQAKPGQAINEVFQALQKLPEKVHLAMVGKGYDAYVDLIEKAGLTGRVHPVEPVLPFEVVPFIQSADLGLILYYPRSVNYRLCLPNGFFQPISAGIPMLYPELPELKNIAKDYTLGLPIDPRSPETMVSGVSRLLNEPGLWDACLASIAQAREALSWENEEKTLGALLDAAMNANTGKGA